MANNKLKYLTLLSLTLCQPVFGAGTAAAPKLFDFLDFTVTNAIFTSWFVSLFIIVVVRMLVKTPKLNPTKGQAFIEIVIEGIEGLVGPIVGKHMVKPTFWLLSGIFVYVWIHNWSGLLPGVGTIGYGHDGHVTTPLIRPANADLNMTAAIAVIAMVSWLYFILKYAGVKVIIKDLFGNKANKSEIAPAIYAFLGGIFLFVGFIEIISICLRPITLSFRLFGNVFGGENLLAKMFEMGPYIVPIPFYFLELLVGIVQALVFTLLVSVYIGLICNHESEEDH